MSILYIQYSNIRRDFQIKTTDVLIFVNGGKNL